MKKHFFVFLFSLTASVFSMTFAQETNIKPFKPEKDMVFLNPLATKSTTLKVGQKAYLQYKLHGSVGIGAEVRTSDETILQKENPHITYKNKQVKGTTGGDAATVTVVFVAKKAGKANVACREMYRGETKNEFEVAIEVIP